MCILCPLVASEAMATLEAMVASEVRYELVSEISNISHPVIYVHIASYDGLGGHRWPRAASEVKFDLRIQIRDLNYIHNHVFLASICLH